MKRYILIIIATITLISCNNTKEKEAQVNENEPKEDIKVNKKPVDSMKIRYADAGLNKQYLENIQKSNKRAAIEEVYAWEELKALNEDMLKLQEIKAAQLEGQINQLKGDADAVKNTIPTLISTHEIEDLVNQIQDRITELDKALSENKADIRVSEGIENITDSYDDLTNHINEMLSKLTHSDQKSVKNQ